MVCSRGTLLLPVLAGLVVPAAASAVDPDLTRLAETAVSAEDYRARYQAIQELGKRISATDAPVVVPALMQAMQRDVREENRVAAINQLASIPVQYPGVLSALERTQDADPSLRVRQEATLAMYRMRVVAEQAEPRQETTSPALPGRFSVQPTRSSPVRLPNFDAAMAVDLFADPATASAALASTAPAPRFSGRVKTAKPKPAMALPEPSGAPPLRRSMATWSPPPSTVASLSPQVPNEPFAPASVGEPLPPQPASTLRPALATRADVPAPPALANDTRQVSATQLAPPTRRWEVEPRSEPDQSPMPTRTNVDSVASNAAVAENPTAGDAPSVETGKRGGWSRFLPWKWGSEPTAQKGSEDHRVFSSEEWMQTDRRPVSDNTGKVSGALPLEQVPRDPQARKEMADRMLAEARRMLEAGRLDDAEAIVYQVSELAVDYGRFEEKPSDLLREIAKARHRQSGSLFPSDAR